TGVTIDSAGGTGNSNGIQGNYIGSKPDGITALPNGWYGINIDSTFPGPNGSLASNTIGGTAAGAGNTISGNGYNGINLNGSGTTATTIQGNYIGLTKNGDTALANGNDGIGIINSPSTTIGGASAAARNVISGNPGWGIDNTADGLVVAGNYIGT